MLHRFEERATTIKQLEVEKLTAESTKLAAETCKLAETNKPELAKLDIAKITESNKISLATLEVEKIKLLQKQQPHISYGKSIINSQ